TQLDMSVYQIIEIVCVYNMIANYNNNLNTNNDTSSTFYVYNKNEMTNAPNPVFNQTYDSNGNLVTSHSGKWTYDYDDENRLVQWAAYATGPTSPKAGDKLTEFVYDGMERLRKRLEWTYVGCQESQASAWHRDS